MKSSLATLIVALLFFGCQTTETKVKKTSGHTSNQSLTQIADELQGNWISKEYIDNIKKTKSVFASRKYKMSVLVAQLLRNDLLKDTATLFGVSDHEGGFSAFLKFDKTKNKFVSDPARLKEYQSFEVPIELSFRPPNLLEIHSTNTNKTEIYQQMKSDLDELLRNTLIAGTYTLQNSAEGVTFSDQGKVNFKNYTHYDVTYDFIEGLNFDAIYFCKQSTANECTNGDVYSFKIEGKKLYLARMKENEDLTYAATGEKYVLINKGH